MAKLLVLFIYCDIKLVVQLVYCHLSLIAIDACYYCDYIYNIACPIRCFGYIRIINIKKYYIDIPL